MADKSLKVFFDVDGVLIDGWHSKPSDANHEDPGIGKGRFCEIIRMAIEMGASEATLGKAFPRRERAPRSSFFAKVLPQVMV